MDTCDSWIVPLRISYENARREINDLHEIIEIQKITMENEFDKKLEKAVRKIYQTITEEVKLNIPEEEFLQVVLEE